MIRYDNEEEIKPIKSKKLIFGLIIIFLGAILLADNFNLLSGGFKSVIFIWQMLLIAIGCLNLFSRKGYFGGLVMILIGVFFLIPEVHPFQSFNFTRLFWPILLIIIGLLIIFRRNLNFRNHNRINCYRHSKTQTGEGFINEVNVFGGSKQRVVSPNFMGGRIISVFGGSEIDLTQSKLAEGTSIIEMVCIFGGTLITVPPDWHIRTEIVSVLGGFGDKRNSIPASSPEKDRELIIKGITIFGGGEIKNF